MIITSGYNFFCNVTMIFVLARSTLDVLHINPNITLNRTTLKRLKNPEISQKPIQQFKTFCISSIILWFLSEWLWDSGCAAKQHDMNSRITTPAFRNREAETIFAISLKCENRTESWPAKMHWRKGAKIAFLTLLHLTSNCHPMR